MAPHAGRRSRAPNRPRSRRTIGNPGGNEARAVKVVSWKPHVCMIGGSNVQMHRSGVLRRRPFEPRYHSVLETTPFVVNLKFEAVNVFIDFPPVRLRANLLLHFEQQLARCTPEDQRETTKHALSVGYVLVYCTRGFKRRATIAIRGPDVPHPGAAFNGFLNTVPRRAMV
jgi:hypothetical protein